MEIAFDEFQMNNNDNPYNLPKDLIFINEIDQGAFAKVIHVKEKKTKKDFALKIVKKSESNIDLINRMKEEIQILKKLQHPNIVQYYGQIENTNQLFIKMEYLKYGTLGQWIQKNKNISEEQASLIIKEVLSAIAYLHQNQICHRDLKPENIMFSRENDISSIKIIDFGLSLQNFDSLCNSDYCGTLIYMAPEEIERKSYYLSVDIWSICILMYMLLNKGEHPFYHNGDTKKTFLNNLKNNTGLVFNNKISFMAMHLIKKLLEYDPIKRYKANDALKHPWITRNPEDKIPQTFNEQLDTFSIMNNAKKLMMISIFLNYLKKNNILCKYKNKSKHKECMKNKSRSTIYKINDEYIKKCEFFSQNKKIKLKELRGKYLYDKKDDYIEKSEEKNNNYNSNINTNSTSNNNLSNSNSSNSNNNLIKNFEIKTTNNQKESKLFLSKQKIKKETPFLLIEPCNLSSKRKERKNFISDFNKYKLIQNNNKNGKNKNINTETINKNYLSESKKRKFFLLTTTKAFNPINKKDINNLKVLDFINKNINNIKPNNLFIKDKNNINVKAKKTESQKNIPRFKLDKIIGEKMNFNKMKNLVNNIKLPDINYNNNINNHKKQKRI
jgi:serine/threonine protein kinase